MVIKDPNEIETNIPVNPTILLTSSTTSKLRLERGPGRPGKAPLTTHYVRVGDVPHVVTHGSPLALVVHEHGALGASAAPDKSDVPFLPTSAHLAPASALLARTTSGQHRRWTTQDP